MKNSTKSLFMESKNFISVVVPAFNEEKYLPLCLRAQKAQSFPKNNYEVIVVDNNSTDSTAKIAKDFGATVISEPKQGYVFALNRGMKEANGAIIAVTDSDTQVYPNWLSLIKEAFDEENVVAVSGIAKVNTGSSILDLIMNSIFKLFAIITAMIGKPNINGFNFAVRRDAFKKVGGLNTDFKMSPDVDLGMRLKEIGEVRVLNNLTVNTSPRRWQKGFIPALLEYAKGYIYAAWLRKPPNVRQKVIR